jgi:hypothetical protein
MFDKSMEVYLACNKNDKTVRISNEEAVAKAIEYVRETNYAPQYYNNEQALRYNCSIGRVKNDNK